jgi:hypothetical protein
MRGPNSRRMNHDTTRRLARIRNGDAAAVDELFALVYDELCGLARAQRRRWEGDHTARSCSPRPIWIVAL